MTDAKGANTPTDVIDERLLRDPFGGYAAIRERSGIAPATLPGLGPIWLVTRYDDAKAALRDPRLVINPANVPGRVADDLFEQVLQGRGVPPREARYLLANVLQVDGADHARLRKLIARAFSSGQVARLRPTVEQLAERVLDNLAAHAEEGVVDLLAHFAYPLPVGVICEMFGIPEPDFPSWRTWSAALTSPSGEGMAKALHELVSYTERLVAERRATPGHDLVSALVLAQEEDRDRLSDVELVSTVIGLLVAGHETTAHLIANGVAALLTHPDQEHLLRERPELGPHAVQEILRWCGTALAARIRYATEDFDIDSVTVSRGDAVMVVLVAANHDPRAFDDPHRFDITRDLSGHAEAHLAFSYGPHYCLGAGLARMECEVAIGALLRRYPALSLAVERAALQRIPALDGWQLTALPVRLGRSTEITASPRPRGERRCARA